jgi:hypothetical protein
MFKREYGRPCGLRNFIPKLSIIMLLQLVAVLFGVTTNQLVMPSILIKYCIMKERNQNQFIKLEKISTKLMLAYLFIKGLTLIPFTSPQINLGFSVGSLV